MQLIMVAKQSETIFACSHCDAQYAKWTGKCLECGKWGTIEEIKKAKIINKKLEDDSLNKIETMTLDDVKTTNVERIKTGINELDRVLGGGLVPGSLILLGGEPGIGKSTLALQLAAILPDTVYLSGEESVEQIKLRADRLHLTNKTLRLGNTTDVGEIIGTIRSCHSRESGNPQQTNRIAVVDSIQTIHSDDVEGEAGNLSQVRACTVKLMELAKTTRTTVILIGQVNKDGNVAGPKTLEHLVDTVLYLEGDQYHQFRILRAAKNRFGSTDEMGIFTMEESGLVEVKNPSALFLSGRPEGVPGSCVTCLMEGTRPLLIEVQALVTKTAFGFPQRRASGFDLNRLQVLIGVLSKRTGLPLESYDVFLNIVGGVRAEEPAADLAVILAIASAMRNKELPKNLVAFGEVGLGGEVRNVSQTKRRLEEIKKLGFEIGVIPPSEQKIAGVKIAAIKNVKEIVEKIIN